MVTALHLQVKMKERIPGVLGNGVLGKGVAARLEFLLRQEQIARRDAAVRATAETRERFNYLRAHDASPRRGRSLSTGGRFASFLRWKDTGTEVAFDAQLANRRVPYWIIQEIGTGQSARVRRGGETVRRGRPDRDEAMVSSPSIPSQRGRVIPSSLAFGTREGGTYTPPGAASNQQLYLRRRLTGPNLSFINKGPRQEHQLVISREIRGQHMVQRGGQEGFGEYRESVLAAARQAFAGQPYRTS